MQSLSSNVRFLSRVDRTLQAMTSQAESCGQRVPEEFVDPRNQTDHYQLLSVFRKVMALKTFEHKFIDFLRAPMDQDGIDKIIRLRQWILEDPRLDDTDWGYLLSTATLEKVREASIELVLNNFYDMGMDDEPYSCCLDVILDGWQAIRPPDILYWYLTGLD